MAHIRQSRPDSGLGIQIKVAKIFQGVAFLLGARRREACGGGRQPSNLSRKQQLKTFEQLPSEKWLKLRPDYGLDRLMCAEFDGKARRTAACGGGRQPSSLPRRQCVKLNTRNTRFVKSTNTTASRQVERGDETRMCQTADSNSRTGLAQPYRLVDTGVPRSNRTAPPLRTTIGP